MADFTVQLSEQKVNVAVTLGSGANSFTALNDVPGSYTGQGDKIVRVKTDETGLEFTTIDERLQDEISNTIQDGTGISWVYDDVNGTFTPTISLMPFSTSDLSEGTNLYFTDERVDDRVNNLLIGGDNITTTYDDVNGTLTLDATGNTTEEIQDIVGGMVSSNTETLISVTYQDVDGTIDFIVNNDLSLYDNTTSGFLSDFTSKSTSDLSEGTNLYFTDERVDDRVNNLLIGGDNITTTYDDAGNTLTLDVPNDLTVISNYSTTDISEGTNLYYTDERVDDRVNSLLIGGDNVTLTYDDINNSLTIDASAGSSTEEDVQDKAWNVLTGTQTLISVVYDDANNNVDFIVNSDLSLYDNTTSGFTTYSSSDFDIDFGNKSTTDLSEGTNLYFTDERVDDRVNNLLIGGDNITTTYDDVANTLTIDATSGTQLTQEQVQDFAWDVLTGTQTLISVVYDDANNNVDFIVNSDLSLYDNTTSGFLSDITSELIQDLSNVSFTTLSSNDILRYDGTNFVNVDFDTEVQALSINNVVEDTTPQLGGFLDCQNNNLQDIKVADFNGFISNSISSGLCPCNWTTGSGQEATLTEDVTSITQTDPISTTGWVRLMFKFTQDATGGRDVTFPTNWVFSEGAPTMTDGTANQEMIITLIYKAADDEYIAQATSWYS